MALSESARLAIRIEATNATDKAFNQLGAQLGRLKTGALALGGALAGGLAFKDVLDSTRQWSRELDTLMDTIGVTAVEASALNYVGRSVGVTTDEMAQSFGILSKRLSDQAEALAKGVSDFDKWGIGVRDASGNTLSFSEILANTRTRLQELGPGMAARALEMDVFGKAGGRLHDMLMLTGEQVTQLEEEMRALGLGSTDQAVGAMEQFERNMARAGMAADALKISLGNALVPAIDEAMRAFIGFVKEAMPTIRDVIIPMVREFMRLAGAVLDFGRAVGRAIGAIAAAAFGVRQMDGFAKSLAETLRRVTGFVKSLTVEFEKFADMVGQKGIFGALLALAGGIKDTIVKALEDLKKKLEELGLSPDAARIAVDALSAALVLLATRAVAGLLVSLANLVLALGRVAIALAPLVLASLSIAFLIESARGGDDAFRNFAIAVGLATAAIALQFRVQVTQLALFLSTTLTPAFTAATTRVWLFVASLLASAAAAIATGLSGIGTAIGTLGAAAVVATTRVWLFVASLVATFAATVLTGLGAVAGAIGAIGAAALAALPRVALLMVAFAPAAIIAAAVLLVAKAIEEVIKTVQLLKDNWDKFSAAFRAGLLDDIPLFGGVFKALRWIGDRIEDAIGAWRRLMSLMGQQAVTPPPQPPPQPGPAPSPRPSGVRGSDRSGRSGWWSPDGSFIPNAADGGIVRARPGGTLVRVGEGGRDEAIVPLPARGGSGTTINVNVHVAGSVTAERDLERFIRETLVRDLRLTRQTA